MVRVLRIIMPLVALVSMVVFVPWGLIWAWGRPLPDTIPAQMQAAIGDGLDGMLVYIDQGGHAPLTYTAGWNNRADSIPVTPNVLFKIASISKLYLAVATAQLVEAGRLSLDQSLAEYLPDFSARIANADQITLRMLVQHRSGIPNFTDHPDYPWSSPFQQNDDTYQLVFDQPADFKPGAKYRYSNTNYLLLGEILDRTLGYSHHRYIREQILEPLGLENTYSLLKEVDINALMSGYHIGYPDDIKYNDFVQPGGSMVATIQDVGVFLRALNDGSLLNEAEQAIYAALYKLEHTGLLPGYESIARYHPEIDAVVVQFVNTSGGYSWNYASINYQRVVKIIKRNGRTGIAD